MPTRRSRTGALLLGLALALTASPATATVEQENMATPLAETGQPQQQESEKRLILIANESGSPIRPGDEFGMGLFVQNRGPQPESYVLTVTLPPEQTLISLDGMSAQCDGSVCRGTVERGADATVNLSLRTRLSSSFQGRTTTIRSELQQDAHPDPGERTKTTTIPVQQVDSASSAPAPSGAAGTNSATDTGQLPRTGERTNTTALVALALLLLGITAQVVGSRRHATRRC